MECKPPLATLNCKRLTIRRSPEASWHTDYRDTAYIYIGGLPFELSEGDVITIFSQFGEPTYINLVRDKETGKSRGFAFLKYEDQRSTDLAVDNLGGAVIMGRTLRVDHTRYKKKDGEEETGMDLTEEARQIEEDGGETRRKRRRTSESESEEERPMLKEERELAKLMQDHDEDDPMEQFLIDEKKEEVAMALARVKDDKRSGKSHKHRHHHRSRRHRDGAGEEEDGRSSHCRREGRDSRMSGSRDPTPEADRDERRRRSRPDDGNREYYKSRRRSPRRDSRDRADRERGSERHGKKGDDSLDDKRHRPRRDS
jgi:RNA-binding motif X-linked protein 2